MTTVDRKYSAIDVSSTAFWSTTAPEREQAFAQLRANEPMSWQADLIVSSNDADVRAGQDPLELINDATQTLIIADDTLGPELAGTGVTLTVVITEPDAVLLLDLPDTRITVGTADDAADATMRMTSDVANRFWQGKVNLPVAMARGQVKVEGRIGALLTLAPSTKQLFPACTELLKADGRDDLPADG